MPDADVLVQCPTCGIKLRARPAARVVRPPVKARVVVGSEAAQSWFTLIMIALLVAIGAGLVVFRDRLGLTVTFGKADTARPAKVAVADLSDLGLAYRAARLRLLDGNAESARDSAQEFRGFDTERVQQPLRNWVTLHAALAHLVAGEAKLATERFHRITDRGAFSKDPAYEKLAAFFLETAKVAATAEPVRTTDVGNLNRGNYEAMALLLYGLKDWALGDYEDAAALLDDFAKSTPAGEDEWIADYKPIASALIAESTEWRAAKSAFIAAMEDPEKQADALAAVKTAREHVGRAEFERQLGEMEAKLSESVAARDAALAKKMAEQAAADATLVAELTQKVEPLCQQYRFAEARALVSAATVSSEKDKPALKLLQRRMEWLARFKTDLAHDISTIGFMGGIKKRDGSALPGAVRRADETKIEAGGSFGSIAIPWAELSPDWLMAAARTFIDATSQLDQKSNRQFDLGIFALMLHREADARAWMSKGAEIKYEYQEAMGVLLD